MSFALVDDFLDSYGDEAIDLTDPDRASVDRTRIQTALDRANGEILTYLSRRYDMEYLNTVNPPDLRTIEIEMARFYLDKLLGQVRDIVVMGYEEAVKRVKSVARGESNFLTESGAVVLDKASMATAGTGASDFNIVFTAGDPIDLRGI